ncbi:MAG TPA: four-carbon acid sugar kinase family protein [Verrucomicrobiae bacterium]
MSKLLITFYGDDFTGSTDALEQLTLAGIRTALFIEPPTPAQLKQHPGLQAIGVAGTTRALSPAAMEKELRPALQKLKALGPRHVHYKICSTFDSSPKVGSIGRVIDVARKLFPAPFVPVLAAAPALGRYTLFGNHFARFGIGSDGEIHRLDRHPSISKHPVTPMLEADLCRHLARQTKRRIALFDVLKVSLPETESRAAFKCLLAEQPEIVLFDALDREHLKRIGRLMEMYASSRRPLFSVGSSGIETALASVWSGARRNPEANQQVSPASSATGQILVGSGSCSPVTQGQIAWALEHGFTEVPINLAAFAADHTREIRHCIKATKDLLQQGRSVIVHTIKRGADKQIGARLKNGTAQGLGMALGLILKNALKVRSCRLCIAGGDTSSFAARALGIEAMEMIAPLTPGAPLCRAIAPRSPADGLEVVFKGGQVGAENYFKTVLGTVQK